MVYYGCRNFAYHFIGIDESIKQGVEQGNQDKEYQYPLVLEYVLQFMCADVEKTGQTLIDNRFE